MKSCGNLSSSVKPKKDGFFVAHELKNATQLAKHIQKGTNNLPLYVPFLATVDFLGTTQKNRSVQA
jgi:hypothetical protein